MSDKGNGGSIDEGPEEPTFIQATSSDGIPYTARSTPSEVTFEVIGYSIHKELEQENAFPIHHIYVRCNDLIKSGLPLDANPRRPSRTSQVKAMQTTLQEKPEDFVKMNNGMALLCRNVEFAEPNQVTLWFSEREGICNGGHTYFAMQTTEFDIPNSGVVHIEAIQIPDTLQGDARKQEIVSIARARNNNNRLELRSEANYLGFYDSFQESLDDSSLVSWHEGDSKARSNSIDAVHFIRLMYSLDPLRYSHPIFGKHNDSHKSPATAKSSIHNAWYEAMEKAQVTGENGPLHHMVPVSNDLFWVRDMLSYSLKHDDLGPGFRRTSLYQEYLSSNDRKLHFGEFEDQVGHDLPPPMEVMFTGFFRSNIWLEFDEEDGIPKYVGWFTNPKQLWNDRKREVLEGLGRDFQDFDSDPKLFIRASAPYNHKLFSVGYGGSPPMPEIIYRIDNRQKFEKVEDEDDAQFWLERETGRGLISLDLEDPHDSSALYIKA